MTPVTSAAEFASRLDTAAKHLRDGPTPKAAVSAGALRMKVAALAEMRRVVPSGRLRNMRNARLTVNYNIIGQTKPTALVQANGPWHIIESDTRPHVIVPKKLGKGRTKAAKHASRQALYSALFGGTAADGGSYAGKKPLKTPYGPRYSVHHPGTRGKHPWARAVETAKAKTAAAMSAAALAEMRKAFKL